MSRNLKTDYQKEFPVTVKVPVCPLCGKEAKAIDIVEKHENDVVRCKCVGGLHTFDVALAKVEVA